MEPREIASILEKISNSGMSIDEYLESHGVPFSRPQYFRYRARYEAEGLDGLIDRRSRGNHRKLTSECEGFIRGTHQANPRMSLQDICDSLKNTLEILVDRSTVSRFLNGVGEQIQWPRPVEPETIPTPCGGFEIIGALAIHLGWAKHTAEVISQEIERFRGSDTFRQERLRRDRKGRNFLGQFTGEYNRREDIRLNRFASVEEKSRHKNYSRTSLFQAGDLVLERKCLGILALPL